MNKLYNILAIFYGFLLFIFPIWKKWIKTVIPHIKGKKILEVSFGNGYLMTNYAANKNFEVFGIDFNKKMLEITTKKIKKKGIKANLSLANVENLPFPNNSFDTVINTMAFTGYPDGEKAISEMKRVLKPGGRLLLVDFDYPKNRNCLGVLLVKIMELCGDIIKNISQILKDSNFTFKETSIGGFGSVHLFVAHKNS